MNILSEDSQFVLMFGWHLQIQEKAINGQIIPKIHENKRELKVFEFTNKDEAIKKLENMLEQLKCLN